LSLDFSLIGLPDTKKNSVEFAEIRAIRDDEVDFLQHLPPRPSGKNGAGLTQIRDRHHWIARLVAEGEDDVGISAVTGISLSRLQMLRPDPAFQELVSHYSATNKTYQLDLLGRLSALSGIAVELLLERMEEDPSQFSNKELRELLQVSADRTGHGPSSTVKVAQFNGLDYLKALRDEVRNASAGSVIPREESPSGSPQLIEGELVPDSSVRADSENPRLESPRPEIRETSGQASVTSLRS